MAHKISTTMKDALKVAGGGLVGAGFALLLAPRAGKEMRREIVSFARTAENKTEKAAHELIASVADFAETVENKASGLLHDGRKMTRDARKELLTAIDKGRGRLDKQRHRIARMIG